MRKKEIRLAWDQEITRSVTEMPDQFIASSAKVSGAPVKRGDLGASPSLAANL